MPYCLGDKPPEGVRVLSHCDLESEHYRALRSNPQYRIEWNRLEWEARQEPPITQERVPEAPSDTPRPVKGLRPIRNNLQQLQAQVLYLQKKLQEHESRSKRKSGF